MINDKADIDEDSEKIINTGCCLETKNIKQNTID